MEQQKLTDVLVQAKRLGSLLHETLDLTRQLAEAIDRSDNVSVRMILAMRQEPIDRAALADDTLRTLLAEADEEGHAHLADLLNGGGAQSPLEQALAERMAANRRTLEEIRTINAVLDKKLSRGRTSV